MRLSSTVPFSKGRLTQVSSASSVTNYTGYDASGRVTGSSQTTNGQTYSFAYGYNLADSLTSETYPSGRVVSTSYDGANRVSGVQGVLHSATTPYVSGASYAPHGGFTGYTFGNQVARAFAYKGRN